MPTPATLLDLTTIPAAERETAILRGVEPIAPGHSMTIVSDVPPGTITDRLEAGSPGRFDCALLDAGPDRWRIEIRRRPAVENRRGVSEFMQWDHDRLDALVADTERFLARGELVMARARFATFRIGLMRHIRMEEEVLFPAFERANGEAGPTTGLRLEHADILALLAQAGAVLASEVAPEGFCRAARRRLLPLLEHHNAREERVVYPQTDLRTAPSAREALVLAMQRL